MTLRNVLPLASIAQPPEKLLQIDGVGTFSFLLFLLSPLKLV